MKTFKIIITSIVALAELLFTFFMITYFPLVCMLGEAEMGMSISMALTLLISGAIGTGYSIYTIYALAVNKKFAFTLQIVEIIALFSLTFIFMSIWFHEYGVAVMFGVFSVIFLFLFILLWKTASCKTGDFTLFNGYGAPFSDSVESHRLDVLREYLTDNRCESASLTDYDKQYIERCSAGYMAYMLAWIIKRSKASEIKIPHSEMNVISDIMEECISPVDFLLNSMGGVISNSDSTSDKTFRIFWNTYYRDGNLKDRNLKNVGYKDDFNEITGGRYCHEFSWDVYRKLEKCIDERYYLFEIRSEDVFERQYGLVNFSSMEMKLRVTGSESLSADYAELCKRYFEDNELWLKSRFISALEDYAAEIGDKINPNDIVFDLMAIYTPKDASTPAFVIMGDWDSDTEHGFGISVLNGEIVEVDGAYDVESPWIK